MGVNITTIAYRRVLIIETGSTIVLMVVGIPGVSCYGDLCLHRWMLRPDLVTICFCQTRVEKTCCRPCELSACLIHLPFSTVDDISWDLWKHTYEQNLYYIVPSPPNWHSSCKKKVIVKGMNRLPTIFLFRCKLLVCRSVIFAILLDLTWCVLADFLKNI